MEGLGAHADRLGLRFCTYRHDHEFLHVDAAVCMLAAVEDVHHRSGKNFCVRAAEVFVERKSAAVCSSSCNCQRDGKSGICAEYFFEFSSVKSDHCSVNERLIKNIEADQFGSDLLIHVCDSI